MCGEWNEHSNATRQSRVDKRLRTSWYQRRLLQRHHHFADVKVNNYVRLHNHDTPVNRPNSNSPTCS